MEDFLLCAKDCKGRWVFENGIVFPFMKYSALTTFHETINWQRCFGIKSVIWVSKSFRAGYDLRLVQERQRKIFNFIGVKLRLSQTFAAIWSFFSRRTDWACDKLYFLGWTFMGSSLVLKLMLTGGFLWDLDLSLDLILNFGRFTFWYKNLGISFFHVFCL